jgi:hypothetical protein
MLSEDGAISAGSDCAGTMIGNSHEDEDTSLCDIVKSHFKWNTINGAIGELDISILTHCGRVTEISVLTLQRWRTGYGDLRSYSKTVEAG